MVGGGQCSSVIVVISTLLGENRGAPSGWRIIHSNNNNNMLVKHGRPMHISIILTNLPNFTSMLMAS